MPNIYDLIEHSNGKTILRVTASNLEGIGKTNYPTGWVCSRWTPADTNNLAPIRCFNGIWSLSISGKTYGGFSVNPNSKNVVIEMISGLIKANKKTIKHIFVYEFPYNDEIVHTLSQEFTINATPPTKKRKVKVLDEILNQIDPMSPHNLYFNTKYAVNPIFTLQIGKDFGVYVISKNKRLLLSPLPDNSELTIKVGYGFEISYDGKFRSKFLQNPNWLENLDMLSKIPRDAIFAIMSKGEKPSFDYSAFRKIASYYGGILNENRLFEYEECDIFGSHFGRDGDRDVYYVRTGLYDNEIRKLMVDIQDTHIITYIDNAILNVKVRDYNVFQDNVTKFGEEVSIVSRFDVLQTWANEYMPECTYEVHANLKKLPEFVEEEKTTTDTYQFLRFIHDMQDEFAQRALKQLYPQIESATELCPDVIEDNLKSNYLIFGYLKCNIPELCWFLPVLSWSCKSKEDSRNSPNINDLKISSFPFTKKLCIHDNRTCSNLQNIVKNGILFPRLVCLEIEFYPELEYSNNDSEFISSLLRYIHRLPIRELIIKSGSNRFNRDLENHFFTPQNSFTQTTEHIFVRPQKTKGTKGCASTVL
jgi:hypothetical protein